MLRFVILFAVGIILAGNAFAEGMTDQAYTSVLLELNRVRPDQNPGFSLGNHQLNARLVDKNQRTMGKIEDIVVAPNGKYETILTKIDTSGFREEVALDVASYITNPTTDTLTVSLDKTQLKQNMAQLMAATSTAAGEDGPFTIRSLQNADIYKTDGAPVAKVKDVLVDSKAMQVVSLLVTISSGSTRGNTIAVPYEASSAKFRDGKAMLTVTDAQALTMQKMATRRY